jgi:hypothetical protein
MDVVLGVLILTVLVLFGNSVLPSLLIAFDLQHHGAPTLLALEASPYLPVASAFSLLDSSIPSIALKPFNDLTS